METDHERSQVAGLIDFQIIFLNNCRTSAKTVYTGHLNGTESTLSCHLGIDWWKITHIKAGRNTAGQIFHDTKHFQRTDVFRIQLVLFWETHLIQPLLQRKIICIGT